MTTRTILYTGKGGVGKTSVAAATGRALARAGLRTLVLSTDPAHSLSASLGTELGPSPAAVGDKLWGQEIDARAEMQRHWSAVSGWLGGLLVERGAHRVVADELAVPPGMDELFSLLALKRSHESGDYDAIVVDCAPTGETLRLLSFPEVARWWLERVVPWERQLLGAVRPLAASVLDLPLPGDAVLADVHRLLGNLIELDALLRDRERVTVRLVMSPDAMVIGEAMRMFTYLNLYGYLTDAIVVNKVFPPELDGGYFGAWRGRQQEQLELVASAFAPVPILQAAFFAEEVAGAEMLDRLAGELFAAHDPAAVLHDRIVQDLAVDGARATLRLELPLVAKQDVSLKKIGLELVVRAGEHRRTIALPPTLGGFRPTGAAFVDGTLEVTFESASAAELASVDA